MVWYIKLYLLCDYLHLYQNNSYKISRIISKKKGKPLLYYNSLSVP